MTDSKIKVDFNLKTFEIEGTEEFIDKYWSEITDLFNKTPSINTTQGLIENTSTGEFGPLEKLSQACELTVEKLKNVFDYDGKKFILISKIGGDSENKKQINGSLLILTAWNKGLGEDWMSSIKLGEALTTRGISTDHISQTLKRASHLFKDNGKSRRSMAYGLKTEGWQEGFKLMRELLCRTNNNLINFISR